MSDSAVAEIQVSIAEMTSEFETMRKSYQDKMQTKMKEVFKAFFEQNSEVAGIVWTQYTPYFADGDECTFDRHDFFFTTDASKLEDIESAYDLEDDSDDTCGELAGRDAFTWSGGSRPAKKGYPEFNKLLESIPQEIYKETFGDHAFIVATAKGFDVREYEHD